MDFVTKSFRKDETLSSWTLLKHICPHFWTWLLNTIAIPPKSEDKYVVKVFNWSEVHLSELTCYKIHILKWKWSSLWSENKCFLVFGQTLDEKTKILDPFLILKKTKLKLHKQKCRNFRKEIDFTWKYIKK